MRFVCGRIYACGQELDDAQRKAGEKSPSGEQRDKARPTALTDNCSPGIPEKFGYRHFPQTVR